MHVLKVIFLVFVAVLIMRLASLLLGGMLVWLTRRATWPVRIGGNLLAFAGYLGFLFWNLVPGDSIGGLEVYFGVVVFGLGAAADLKWYPWARRAAEHQG